MGLNTGQLPEYHLPTWLRDQVHKVIAGVESNHRAAVYRAASNVRHGSLSPDDEWRLYAHLLKANGLDPNDAHIATQIMFEIRAPLEH